MGHSGIAVIYLYFVRIENLFTHRAATQKTVAK
jgi:hypothetical protein